MTEASPRPWRAGNHNPRTIYCTPPPGERGDIGRMDRDADAALVIAAVNAYGLPCPLDADLREGLQQSERRRLIAAVVAAHHQECLVVHRSTAPMDQVRAAFEAVLAALGGSTDVATLGLAGYAPRVDQVQAIVGRTGGEVARG